MVCINCKQEVELVENVQGIGTLCFHCVQPIYNHNERFAMRESCILIPNEEIETKQSI